MFDHSQYANSLGYLGLCVTPVGSEA